MNKLTEEKADFEKRSYYAVIPADVRYNENLPANAKLLYGEITALCNERGYCWATNNYFADLYRVKMRVVQYWIAALQKQGFIRILVGEKGNTRKIELTHHLCKNLHPPMQKTSFPRAKKDARVSEITDEKAGPNNTLNKTSIINPSLSPLLSNGDNDAYAKYRIKKGTAEAKKSFQTMEGGNGEIDDLIERIVEFTESPGSVKFYRKAIEELGTAVVEGEMAEVRYRTKMGKVENPAKYLTALLTRQMENRNVR